MATHLTFGLEGFFDKPSDDFPVYLKEWLGAAIPALAARWDNVSPEARRAEAEKWAKEQEAVGKDGETVGWWDSTMNASHWWKVESVSPLDAAMLLSRHNPHEESRSSAEKSTSDEMNPGDFKMLLAGFEGAYPGKRRLKDWSGYAAEQGFKTHSWIKEWEAAKRRATPEFFADEQETSEETAASSHEGHYERLRKQKEELTPDWIALANKAALDIADWIRLTDTKINPEVKTGDYEISRTGVRVRPYSEDQIARAPASEQAWMLDAEKATQLHFPCTPSDLLRFIDHDDGLGVFFVVPDEFRDAVIARQQTAPSQTSQDVTKEQQEKTGGTDNIEPPPAAAQPSPSPEAVEAQFHAAETPPVELPPIEPSAELASIWTSSATATEQNPEGVGNEQESEGLDPWMLRAREHANNICLRDVALNKRVSKEGIAPEIAGRLHRDDKMVTKTGKRITVDYVVRFALMGWMPPQPD